MNSTMTQENHNIYDEYETVIGLEVHVELRTKTKLFCNCATTFGQAPNAHTCPVCLGFPGTLPVFNKKVLEYAIMVGLVTNCTITPESRFDRKNYFYPDNPQNYQISQLYAPICREGYVELDEEITEKGEVQSEETGEETGDKIGDKTGDKSGDKSGDKIGDKTGDKSGNNSGNLSEKTTEANEKILGKEADLKTVETKKNRKTKRIGILEIHMEEDAGKLIHDEKGNTLVDYNRAGVPLLEIVTKPDLRNAEDTIAFLQKLRLLIKYLGVSDCKLQEGSMRADVNLSVRKKGEEQLGTRTEMKNLSSFHSIQRAIEEEKKRQIALLERGEKVEMETRRWDENKEESFSMRSKEEAKDYRYFPDPDLGVFCTDEEEIERIRGLLPELAHEKAIRYEKEYGLGKKDIALITSARKMAEIFEETASLCGNPKKAANWMIGETCRLLRENKMEGEELRFSASNLAQLIQMTEDRLITGTIAKEIFEVMFMADMNPLEYAKEKGLLTENDEAALLEVIRQVVEQNPKSVEDYHNGKEKAIGFLVGQTMRAMKGKADAVRIGEILKQML